ARASSLALVVLPSLHGYEFSLRLFSASFFTLERKRAAARFLRDPDPPMLWGNAGRRRAWTGHLGCGIRSIAPTSSPHKSPGSFGASTAEGKDVTASHREIVSAERS